MKAHLISAFHTFVSAFIFGIGGAIVMHNTIEWTAAFWFSIVLAGIRVGVKACLESFWPKTFKN